MNTDNTLDLETLAAEGRAELAAQAAARQAELAAQVEKVRAAMAAALPVAMLAALGLDLMTLTVARRERYTDAAVAGRCTFRGEVLKTRLTFDTYNRVELFVEDVKVALDERVLVGSVGIALVQAWEKRKDTQRRELLELETERQAKVQRLRHRTQNWGLDDSELQGQALTLEKLPFIKPDELAEIRGMVAARKWRERQLAHAARRRVAAQDAERRDRAAALLRACQGWVADWAAYRAACARWAQRWTDALSDCYGIAELWYLTYTPAGWLVGGEEDADSAVQLERTIVVLEAPADLADAVHGLTRVTEVQGNGRLRHDVYVGPILRMERMPVTPSTTQALPYHRVHRCGGAIVNVPPALSERIDERFDDHATDSPPIAEAMLRAAGFERLAQVLAYGDFDVTDVTTLDDAVELLQRCE